MKKRLSRSYPSASFCEKYDRNKVTGRLIPVTRLLAELVLNVLVVEPLLDVGKAGL